MNREEELTDILQKIDRGQMDIAVAFDRILRLFSVGQSEQLKCPKCGSNDIKEGLLKLMKCNNCKHRWAF